MSDILDRGSLLFACVLAIAVSVALPWTRFYIPLLVLAAVYVPGLLLIAAIVGRLGSLGIMFQRDYAPLLTCTAMAFAAAALPMALAVRTVPAEFLPIAGGVFGLYFAILMFFAVRTVFGTGNGLSAGVVSLSWGPLVTVFIFLGPLKMLLNMVASPFFLVFAIYYLRSEFTGIGDGLRRQQNMRRMLEAAAVNPHDGEAQYQIGLIHQQRRRYSEAIERFKAAVAIDNTETDAHFQLGRIAYAQKRYDDALAGFLTVLKQDEKHSQSEVHRELGATYLALGKLDDARRELAIYVDRRPYDPQGLYFNGRVLEVTGDKAGAKDMYAQSVEAARTAPAYRRRFVAEWSRMAQRQSRKL
jgi:predicted negative regulator of RcsB-dependent stress response